MQRLRSALTDTYHLVLDPTMPDDGRFTSAPGGRLTKSKCERGRKHAWRKGYQANVIAQRDLFYDFFLTNFSNKTAEWPVPGRSHCSSSTTPLSWRLIQSWRCPLRSGKEYRVQRRGPRLQKAPIPASIRSVKDLDFTAPLWRISAGDSTPCRRLSRKLAQRLRKNTTGMRDRVRPASTTSTSTATRS